MGYYNTLSLGDTDGELFSDEGWHVDDRRPTHALTGAPAGAVNDRQPPATPTHPSASQGGAPTEANTPAASVHTTPAHDLAVVAALERLAEIEARAARLARTRGDAKEAGFFQRAANAYAKALGFWLTGLRPTKTPNGYLLPSQRPGEAPHKLHFSGDWLCTCPAGESMHWAKALLIGMEVAQDDLDQFGGETEAPPPPPPPFILVEHTPPGLTLSRDDVTCFVTTPAEVAGAIGRLSPAARMGQRLALAGRFAA